MKKRFVLLLVPMLLGSLLAYLPTIIYKIAVPVNTVKPEAITYQRTISYIGQVEPSDTKEIYLETAVIPSNIFVEPGDYVRKGELLASIDTQLTKTVLAQGVYTSDENQTKKKKKLLEEYGKAYGLTDEAAAQVFNTRTTSPVQRSEDALFIPSDLFSPMDGIVTQVNLSADTLCSPNKAAIVVNSIESCKVTIQLRQSDVDEIQVGTAALIQGEGLNGRTYQAVVQKIFPTAQKEYNGFTSETVVQTELIVYDWDENLKSGYSVEVVLMPEEPVKYFSLPYEAVCQDKDNTEYVLVAQNGRAVRRNIVTGVEMPEAVEIQSGLSFWDDVILSPSGLEENQLINVRGEK